MRKPDYAILIEPLPEEDGGGFLATVPDLPGCMSDDDTREAAARNIDDAIAAWLEEARTLGRDIPLLKQTSPPTPSTIARFILRGARKLGKIWPQGVPSAAHAG